MCFVLTNFYRVKDRTVGSRYIDTLQIYYRSKRVSESHFCKFSTYIYIYIYTRICWIEYAMCMYIYLVLPVFIALEMKLGPLLGRSTSSETISQCRTFHSRVLKDIAIVRLVPTPAIHFYCDQTKYWICRYAKFEVCIRKQNVHSIYFSVSYFSLTGSRLFTYLHYARRKLKFSLDPLHCASTLYRSDTVITGLYSQPLLQYLWSEILLWLWRLGQCFTL